VVRGNMERGGGGGVALIVVFRTGKGRPTKFRPMAVLSLKGKYNNC
jgi:hypothetical protein